MITIKNNFKILLRYLILSFKNQMAFKFDFAMKFISTGFEISYVIIFWVTMSQAKIIIPNWPKEKIYLLMAFNIFSQGISKLFFGLRDFEFKVLQGDFDLYLVRPSNPVAAIVMEKLNVINIILKFSIAFSFLFILSHFYLFTWSEILGGLILSIFGTIAIETLYAIVTLFSLVLGRIYSLRELLFLFRGASQYPMDVFPKFFLLLMTSFIPLAYVSTIPTNYVFNQLAFVPLFTKVIVAFSLMLLLLKLTYQLTIKHYQSTGN